MRSGVGSLLGHSALGRAAGAPLDSVELSDRQKVGVILQAGSVLSLVQLHGDLRIRSWTEARIDKTGLLTGLTVVPGRQREPAQVRLRVLARALFGSQREIAGRGEARRIVRRLMSLWSFDAMPVSPDDAVRHILDLAGFIWTPGFALHRTALAGKHGRGGAPRLWVAGPGWFRSRLLQRGRSLKAVEERLQSEEARRIWQSGRASGSGGSAGCRWHELNAASESRSRKSASDRLARASALRAVGRFADAVEELSGLRTHEATIVRASCLVRLGELRRALRELDEVESGELSGDSLLEASSIAVTVCLRAGRRERAESWFSRAVREARCEAERCRAELLGFSIAAARSDAERAARHIDAAAPAVGLPEVAWRWHRARGDLAMRTGRSVAARVHFRSALKCRRRSLSPVAAADLWTSLACARRESGDLSGAERALRHAVRLQRDAIGSEGWIRALAALAEVRLRRGGPAGANDLLIVLDEHRSRCKNAGLDLLLASLQTRHELARGRADAAAEVARVALEALAGGGDSGEEEELRVLLARACGWQGRAAEAREILETQDVRRRGPLEPEELPALWMLAGCREEALRETGSDPAAAVWCAVLEGRSPTKLELELTGELGRYRYARLIVDVEAAAPGRLPRQRVREAARFLRSVDADAHARRLEDGEDSRWRAVAAFLSTKRRDLDAVVRLFDDSGYGNVRLLFRPAEGASELIMGGDGGDQDLIVEVDEGTLELRAPAIDSTLRVLASVVAPPLGAAHRTACLSRDVSSRSALPMSGMVGESRVLRVALERLGRLASGEIPVLIYGETGTGKELAARGVHAGSSRASGPFVPFNCAAAAGDLLLSDLFGHVRGSFTGAVGDRAGVFEAARGGTVFLDEVGDLPLRAQGFLLRVLQEGEVRRVGESRARRVDARVVSATHTDLEGLVRRGEFRADLFYRLGGARVELPPLRRRSGDIPLLARHFLDRAGAGASRRLTRRALAALRTYGWPGNVRELENVLSVAVQVADKGPIRLEHLEIPASRPTRGRGYHERVRDYRRNLVREAMIASEGNGAEAARRLGVTRQALSYLVRSLGVDP